jgi:DNA-directed RNA polymerase subunit RPC12/RpoP
MPFLPCVLCSRKLEMRMDKHHKPYFVCNQCGIQLFIRRQNGIVLLGKVLHDASKDEPQGSAENRSA